ncbi:MAG: UDP-N-acetylmuramate dehydrogenase [Elusimicrobiota bacterium]
MSWCDDFIRLFPQARLNEPMRRHSTYRIGGPADVYLEACSVADLVCLYRLTRRHKLPVLVLGWGSNLLVRDGGIRGVVVRLRGEFERVEMLGETIVRAGAAVRLPQLVMRCAERGLTGAESLVGVPGTVGGGLVMNAGTPNGAIGDLVRAVEVFDPGSLKVRRLTRSRIRFAYRSSSLRKRIVIAGTLELRRGIKVDIIKTVKDFQRQRQKTQPIHTFNVGSVFKNPPGCFAAKLIQDAGLKGKTLRGAKVSDLHANFIENYDHASAADVLELVAVIRDTVRKRTGIGLELEMKVVGEKA